MGPTPSPPLTPAPRSRADALRAFLQRDSGLLLLAALVGVFGGLGAVGFRYLIGFVQWVAFGNFDGALAAHAPSWRLILVPVLGALVVGPMIAFWCPETRGHGVPELMRTMQLGRGLVRARLAVTKALASALTIGSGGSCGREGPIAQIGAAFGSMIGQFATLSPRQLKVLVGAGAAAGIAATFNAPIAGAFFALEVLLGNFAMECFAPIVAATVPATLLSRVILGSAPSFALHGEVHDLRHPAEMGVYVVLGIAAGLVALAFTHLLALFEELGERLPTPDWVRPVWGGLGVGILAWLGMPFVMGNGSETIEVLLGPARSDYTLLFLLGLMVAKLLATCFTLGSGASGGVFSPSLFVGASLGAFIGHLAGTVLPFPTADPGAYALVGMAAVAGGTTHAPITMMLIVFELTNDYAIIAPLMVATSIAALVARRISPESIYTLKLSRQGIHLNPSLEHMVMHHLHVDDVMRSRDEAEVVSASEPLHDVIHRFLEARVDQVYVVGGQGEYDGTILLQDVKGQLNVESLSSPKLVIAEDVARTDLPIVNTAQPLTAALEALYRSNLHELPVVMAESDPPLFVGTLSEHDLLGAYNEEVLRQEVLLARFISRAPNGENDEAIHTDYFELPQGYGLAQVPISLALSGKSLAELNIRKSYGVNVLAIKLRDAEGDWTKRVPEPDQTLRRGDLLIVMGPLDGIEALRRGDPSRSRRMMRLSDEALPTLQEAKPEPAKSESSAKP